MSYIFLQAQAAESLAGNCLDTDACAPSSGSPTPKLCCWHDSGMDSSRLSRFGVTCKPLTADHGAALLTSFVEDSRARTSAWPEKAQGLTASAAACGTTWPASLARYDPDSHSLKTAQLSLVEDLTGCCVTLPRSGLMQGGQLWELPTLGRRTSGTESGYWQPPVADDCVNRAAGKINSRGEPKLSAQVMRFPTPRSSDHKGSTNPAAAARGYNPNLPEMVAELSATVWPTPQARDYRSGDAPDSPRAIRKREAGWSPNLNDVVMWPTPNAMLAASDLNFACSGDGRETPNKLGLAVANHMKIYPTATATATAYKGWSPNHNRADTDNRLDYTVERESFAPGQQTPPMRLNPDWVEWLMGWPIGQTALKPLETGKYQEWQQQHSLY